MVIADTGFWLALANSRDAHHCHLLSSRLGQASQLAFVGSMAEGAFELYEIPRAQWPRLGTLMEKYEDLPMDLADASLLLLAEHLGHGQILSTDRPDFGTYRWKQHQPFENLLLPS